MSSHLKARKPCSSHNTATTTTKKTGEGQKPSLVYSRNTDLSAEKQQIAALLEKIQRKIADPKSLQKAAAILTLWIQQRKKK